ncbi:nucleotide-diphospho-sugar transferase [Gongronella butleri]|nr:nucleotide-diphospho-sugar transferase [Gongronella butleri]
MSMPSSTKIMRWCLIALAFGFIWRATRGRQCHVVHYTREPSVERIKAQRHDVPFNRQKTIPPKIWDGLPVRGVFYMTAHNEDIGQVRETMRSVKDNINTADYPWVFLSSSGFTYEFVKYVSMLANGRAFFGYMDPEAFAVPQWVHTRFMESSLRALGSNKDIYMGGSLLHHQTMRYQSGLFYHHPLFQDVQMVWKMEPGMSFKCNVADDPFMTLRQANQSLGFVLTAQSLTQMEYKDMRTFIKQYLKDHHRMIKHPKETIFKAMLLDDAYYGCQIGHLTEILDMQFLKSFHHQHLFNFMDNSGGFFYAPWSDAMFRSIAAGFFLRMDQVRYFNEIGVIHPQGSHCPFDLDLRRQCSCDPQRNQDFAPNRCIIQLLDEMNPSLLTDMARYAIHHLNGTVD